MIQPAPTSKIDPKLARGVLSAVVEPTATKPGYIVIEFLNSSYQVHLQPAGPVAAQVGKRIVGTIKAKARRIDEVKTGGRYVEPVMGRPRRVQGTVIAVEANAVVVDAGMPIHCEVTDARQKPGDFAPGQLVSFDVLEGATFSEA